MAQQTFRNIIAAWGFSLLSALPAASVACSWDENSETVRLAMFRAGRETTTGFTPFYYSAEYFNSYSPDPEGLDRLRNCKEWAAKAGAGTPINDVDFILYHTPPELFEKSFQSKSLAADFEGNVFVAKLSEPKNKALLEYLVFAKMLENNSLPNGKWETWEGQPEDAENNEALDRAEKLLPTLKDDFLRDRYAYLLLRTYSQAQNDGSASEIYNTYFEGKQNKGILGDWAFLFKAMLSDRKGNKAEADYYYSLAFDRCEEKKLAVMQNFNRDSETVQAAMAFAQNDRERGVLSAMAALRNPGPALEDLQKTQALLPGSEYVRVLVGREINKLEDWIFTSKFTIYGPSVYMEGRPSYWDEGFEKARDENYQKDLAYLKELKSFLESVYPAASGAHKEFLAVALAHLSFMDGQTDAGKKYLAAVGDKASPSCKAQKNIELALIELKEGDMASEKSRNVVLASLKQLEGLAKLDQKSFKNLYSLARMVAETHKEKGDAAMAGLAHLKSERYKQRFEANEYYSWDYLSDYSLIGYFDRNADFEDMTKLIALIPKKDKTPYETYLCDQPLAKVDFYKDLQATIAIRKNDLATASKIFESMPKDFWATNYYFKDYLDADPFLPKVWYYAYKPDSNYVFNKLDFVKKVMSLQAELKSKPAKKAENALLLGHAYFNMSYYGNSWMMVSYGQSVYEQQTTFTDAIFSESMYGVIEKSMEGNYYGLGLARKYYAEALAAAQNDEQRAQASLMLHVCDYSASLSKSSDPENPKPYTAGQELIDFYSKYRQTTAFQNLQCTLLEDFVAKAGGIEN